VFFCLLSLLLCCYFQFVLVCFVCLSLVICSFVCLYVFLFVVIVVFVDFSLSFLLGIVWRQLK